MSDKLRGDEVRSIALIIAAPCNKEGVEKTSTCGQSVFGFLLLISASALRTVGGHAEEHFEVSRKPGNGYGRRKERGITHGNLLRTYKRECRRAFSQTLQQMKEYIKNDDDNNLDFEDVTLVKQTGLARTNM